MSAPQLQYSEDTISYPKSPFVRNPRVESQLFKRNIAFPKTLLPWLCRTPTITTYRVNLLRTTVEAFKLQVQEILTGRNESTEVYALPQIPEVLCIASSAKTPLTIAPDTALKEVVVDCSCGSALLRGAHIYAPGVLAMEKECKVNEQVAVFADLAGKCKRGTSIRYESAEKLFVGVGVVRMQRYQLFSTNAINGIAVEMIATISGVPSLGDLTSADALLQNLPSIVCVRVLDPQPGERILDMCAAPGNKTTHIAEMIGDRGVVVALDKIERKILRLKEKIAKLGLKSVSAFTFDATKAYLPVVGVNSIAGGCEPPFTANSFDRILLDAPCSALGNRPILSSNIQPKMLTSFPHMQRKLFATAVQLLKPNGVLVYSTCTITEDENEGMVAWVLRHFPQMQLVAAVPKLGADGLDGTELEDQQRKLVQRFGLATTNAEDTLDTIGFFIAKFIKIE